jgi:hypothetical protein
VYYFDSKEGRMVKDRRGISDPYSGWNPKSPEEHYRRIAESRAAEGHQYQYAEPRPPTSDNRLGPSTPIGEHRTSVTIFNGSAPNSFGRRGR